jgi:hypothetical protein
MLREMARVRVQVSAGFVMGVPCKNHDKQLTHIVRVSECAVCVHLDQDILSKSFYFFSDPATDVLSFSQKVSINPFADKQNLSY